ncbi:protein FAR1-RELATED SEQUENCE 5-like [Camellia sinensis]|uniref:protein FAR1-RELATED SEQUENCE 5-like n=1 Tax=Camellia sinensis TaxID=4442 RepID=UPI00103616DD|nr:protein FAR1-RELATED SEQUENCE 5-like [Camellia sinensis]
MWVFKNKEELLNWVWDVGRKKGFVIVIKTSDYGGGHRTPRIFLACERSGQYRAHKKLKEDDSNKKIVKITGTKKCRCPFELMARKLMANDDWMVDVACGMHNHAPTKHFEGHLFVVRLSEEETSLLVDLSKSMVKPKEILVTLKRNDALNVTTMKTIYNVCHRNNVIEKAQMQQLLGELEKHNYIKRHRCDNNTMTATDLFWAHPVSLDLLRSFPKVLIMDCTYKTNRYHLPLLEIVSVTSIDILFDDIAIPEVIVMDMELALMNAIDSVFSASRHLLCRWHIGRNVLAKCKKMFKSKEECDKFISLWNFLILFLTELEYNEHLARLLADFDTYSYAVAESEHAKLKRQLGSNQVIFECSWPKIHSLLELQHIDIKASFEKSLTIVQHQFKPSHFRELRDNISRIALDHVLAESKRVNDVGINALVCGYVVRRTHGIKELTHILSYFEPNPEYHRWMTMPDMGHLIASCYNVV